MPCILAQDRILAFESQLKREYSLKTMLIWFIVIRESHSRGWNIDLCCGNWPYPLHILGCQERT